MLPALVAAAVPPAAAAPVDLRGSLSAQAVAYGINGIEERREPFSWLITANATLTVAEIAMPFTLVLSEQERSFRQPFNQFGISPSRDWWTVHVGYRSLRYTDYTLNNAKFLGIGADANPGNWRLFAMYGRFQRAIEEDTTRANVVVPAYERRGWGAKAGYVLDRSSLDVSIFTASDDEGSLAATPGDPLLLPGENAAVGARAEVSVSKFKLTADWGGSVFTPDNTSTDPVGDETFLMGLLGGLITTNGTTTSRNALLASAGYYTSIFDLRLQFDYIEPDYQTFGAYFFNTDRRAFTVEPTLRLLQSTVTLSGSYGREADNLDDAKPFTTTRTIGSGSLAWNPGSVFGITFNASNYGTDQDLQNLTLSDTLLVGTDALNLSVSPRVTLRSAERLQSFTLLVSYQQFDNDNELYAASNSEAVNTNLGYTHTLVASGLSFGGGVSYNTSKAEATPRNEVIGGNANVSGQALAKKLSWSGGVSYGGTMQEGDLINATTTFTARGDYRLTDADLFNADLTIGINTGTSAGVPDFQEYTFRFGYTRQFGI